MDRKLYAAIMPATTAHGPLFVAVLPQLFRLRHRLGSDLVFLGFFG
jgi:hypothetical protein